MAAVAARLAQLAMQLADCVKSVSSEHFVGVYSFGPPKEGGSQAQSRKMLAGSDASWSQASGQLEQNRTEAKRPVRRLKEEYKETASKQKAREISPSQTGFQVFGGSFAK